MTDIEWAIAIVRAWKATDSMDTSIDMVRTFRAEVLKEAAERAVEWLVVQEIEHNALVPDEHAYLTLRVAIVGESQPMKDFKSKADKLVEKWESEK